MSDVYFSPGMHIADAAAKLCAVAADQGSARGEFNGVPLVATRGIKPDEIVAAFEGEIAARAKAYRESPAGILAAERRDAERQTKQGEHDALMDRLPSLNWDSKTAILDWLCAMQAPSDHVGVILRKDTIAAAFAEHLYEPGMDCGAEYRPGVENSEFRYLIGQALDGIVNGPAIHPILHKFVAEWKARWVPNSDALSHASGPVAKPDAGSFLS